MKIKKMITISALHVSESTYKLLGREISDEETEYNLIDYFEIYKASEWGYILNCPSISPILNIPNCPQDLKEVLMYAFHRGCSLIYLDIDGEIVPDLKVYDNQIIEDDTEKEYTLTYYETYEGSYSVKAKSREEAEKLIKEDIFCNDVGPDLCVDSGFRENYED